MTMVALRKKTLSELVVGDRVIRILGGEVAMPLPVTAVTESFIICGPYTFSRRNGAEIDEDLGWNETQSGSVITP